MVRWPEVGGIANISDFFNTDPQRPNNHIPQSSCSPVRQTMYLQCVLGQFGPVAEVKVIVRWPGLSGSISGSPAKVNYVHMSNIDHTSKNPGRTINQLLTYVEAGISRLSADIDITRT